MGRPRKYATPAERQAAYRARLARDQTRILIGRRSLELLEANQERLRDALSDAARHGDPLARRCRAASAQTCLEKLAVWFEEQATRSGHDKQEET